MTAVSDNVALYAQGKIDRYELIKRLQAFPWKQSGMSAPDGNFMEADAIADPGDDVEGSRDELQQAFAQNKVSVPDRLAIKSALYGHSSNPSS